MHLIAFVTVCCRLQMEILIIFEGNNYFSAKDLLKKERDVENCRLIKSYTMKKAFSLFVLFCSLQSLMAQNTIRLENGQASPAATLQDVKWISGNWVADSPFGYSEENWGIPSGNTMMFCFKMMRDNAVFFYELGHIEQKDTTILLRIRHFNAALQPIAQSMQEEFKLVKIEKDRVCFEGITYEKSGNGMNVYVFEEDAKKELKFEFKKAKK